MSLNKRKAGKYTVLMSHIVKLSDTRLNLSVNISGYALLMSANKNEMLVQGFLLTATNYLKSEHSVHGVELSKSIDIFQLN